MTDSASCECVPLCCRELNTAVIPSYADWLVKNGVKGVFGKCVY